MTTTLRNRRNEIAGYLEEKQDEIVLRDSHNQILGRYSRMMNRTYGKHGEIVSASGNILLTLLCDK